MKKGSSSFSKDIQIDLSIPHRAGQINIGVEQEYQNHNYQEQPRIVSNQLKGNKIYMSQYRQKQQLKTKSSHNHNVVRSYLHNVLEPQYNNVEESVTQSHNYLNGTVDDQYASRSTRPRTGGMLTADHAYRNRKKRMQLNAEAYRHRTMVVTSSGIRAKSNPLRPSNYFVSHNLDNKMNDFMNLVIRNENKNATGQQSYISQMHTEGVIPHSRKLNSYQRNMKIRRRQKAKTLSKDKMTINLETDIMDLKTISKTLETITSHSKSPLVVNLEHKTIFGRLSAKNNIKKPPFYHME